MDDIVLKLQEVVAHQQQDLARMSDELYAQQQEINRMAKLLRALQAHVLQQGADGAGGDASQEPPPPHY